MEEGVVKPTGQEDAKTKSSMPLKGTQSLRSKILYIIGNTDQIPTTVLSRSLKNNGSLSKSHLLPTNDILLKYLMLQRKKTQLWSQR